MNKRQAKKKEKVNALRKEYDFLPLKTIKKYNRQYDAFFNSPMWKKKAERQMQMRMITF